MNVAQPLSGACRTSIRPGRAPAALPWLFLGGVGAALLDLAIAMAWWGPSGVGPLRIAQGIAAWYIGSVAFSGGAATAWLGLALYCHMMFAVVVLYHVASLRYRAMLRRPLAYGAAYGAACYVLILEVGVPLFAAHPTGSPDIAWRMACLCAYMLLVGGASAWAAMRAQGYRTQDCNGNPSDCSPSPFALDSANNTSP